MPKALSFIGTFGKKIQAWFASSRNVLLVVFTVGIFAIVFGYFKIANSIKGPFKLEDIAEPNTQIDVEQGLSDLADLRIQDTDKDGLTDYAELYIYNTSSYLPDSDSDGYDDKVEIMSGHSPTCPAGQNCFGETVGLTDTQTDALAALEELNPLNISNEELRQMLTEYGLDPEILAQFDDETLRAMFDQAMSEVQEEQETKESAGNASQTVDITDPQLVSDLKSLTPTEIRQLLIESGAPEDQLNQLSDEELQDMYNQILAEELLQ